MRLIFAGTPDFAAEALKTILSAGHTVVLALTQPDRRSGRGMALTPSPVKRCAGDAGIPVLQPETLKDPVLWETIDRFEADMMIVCAYGLILPQSVLDIPRLGCLNIHASLLPRWRGAAPIQRAILSGDAETGVSIMRMEAGLDTGPVLMSEHLPVAADETAGSLHDKLAALGGQLMVRTLARWPLPAQPQSEAGVTYAGKIEKSEARIDWARSAEAIERQVRAFNPFPGANFLYRGDMIKVWKSRVERERAPWAVPGTILRAEAEGLIVACGEHALCVLEAQKAGGRRLPIAQFLAGTSFSVGSAEAG